ncbi:MAG: stage II sporulation protein D [Bacillota bacterium]|nr:stage II sporulation protein D [Bacillota bacterium]
MKRSKKIVILVLGLFICVGLFLLFQMIRNNQADKNNLEPFISLYLHQSSSTINLTLENYIIGAVTAEMPLSFEMEALKAQAVCARTYAIRKIIEDHDYPEDADLSDNIATCQAFITIEHYKQRNPSCPTELLEHVKEAVRLTRGEIILYDSKPADTVYHSCCGGRTASAEESWGNPVLYLQSVPCEYCSASAHFLKEQTFSVSSFASCLNLSEEIENIGVVSQTESGRTKKIKVNNKTLQAFKVRAQLGLPSTWMEFSRRNGAIIVQTRGYGHGVGMCQYGANGMAKKGYSYREILNHYYQDIDFYKIPY